GPIELNHVPSGRALDGSGHILVKVLPLQPKLAFVTARALTVINPVEVKLRRAAAVECRLDGNTIANFPMETCGWAGARDGTPPVFQKVVPLVVRHHQLR